MIKLFELKKGDIETLKSKKIAIYGIGKSSRYAYDILKHIGVKDVAYWVPVHGGFLRLKIFLKNLHYRKLFINTKKLKAHSNVQVQLSEFEPDIIKNVVNRCNKLNVPVSNVEFAMLALSFHPQVILSEKNQLDYLAAWKSDCNAYKKFSYKWTNYQKAILICLPQKTADFTLMNTFSRFGINEKKKYIPLRKGCKTVSYINLWHRPKAAINFISNTSTTNLKIITAVREPISQNLSSFYQMISGGTFFPDWIFGELEGLTPEEAEKVTQKMKDVFVAGARDGQLYFDAFIERYVYGNKSAIFQRAIQQFMLQFQSSVIDVMSYPFDKEKGYTIIKDNGVDVFVYQLEKLNDLVPELSAWVGVPFEQLECGNDASDKWIADSYKKAQKEIQISQEYFDKCFDEPYVKHCYSEADIEKFKARWRPHIKK